jgi:pimeloyl-ACP methyl ester carboxylesterase
MPGQVEGPWHHRHVAANGARFHVAEMGDGPLILMLHGFPEFWWAWRSQLPRLAAAGYRAAAMDLRGYGNSDKPPRGYDALTLAADVAGVVRTLGSRDAVVVGHGWGGYVAWAVAASRPDCLRALCAVAAPHPVELLRSAYSLSSPTAMAHIAAMQLPWWPERRIMRSDYIARHLASWAAPGSSFPTYEVVERYRQALAAWPSPHCALEYHRWLFRSRMRTDGRAFAATLRQPIDVPVLQITGAQDRAVPRSVVARSARRVAGRHEHHELGRAGHFPHEEMPDEFNDTLLRWLSQGAAAGVDGAG